MERPDYIESQIEIISEKISCSKHQFSNLYRRMLESEKIIKECEEMLEQIFENYIKEK